MMKTATRIALACLALAATSHASAQSDVRLYGQIGVGLNNTVASGSGLSVRTNTMTDNAQSMSYFGFTGSEDLGGGLSAIYRLESGVAADIGSAGGSGAGGAKFFNKQSWVGLRSASAGTLTFGRQFHVLIERVARTLDVNFTDGAILQVLPLGLFGVNKYAGSDSRVDNSLKYRLSIPEVMDFGVSYGLSERVPGAGAPAQGASYSLDIARSTKEYAVGATYVHYDNLARLADGSLPQYKVWAVGGNFALGDWRPYLSYFDSRFDSATLGGGQQVNRIVSLGLAWKPATAPQWSGTLALYHDQGRTLNGAAGRDGNKNTLVATGYYGLSKRTDLYALYSRSTYSGGYQQEKANQATFGHLAAPLESVTGLSVGMRHKF